MSSLLGFTYRDLVLASIIKEILAKIPDHFSEHEEILYITNTFFEDRIDVPQAAFLFERSIGDDYKSRNLIEQYLVTLLKSPEYFPEQNEHFAEGSLPELHAELFKFWKDYNIHLKYRKAIDILAKLAGIRRLEINQSSNSCLECLYHRGMIEVDADIQEIVKLYNTFKTLYGYTPALPVPGRSFEEDIGFCFSKTDKNLSVYYPTLSGVIYFDGSTDVNNSVLNP